MADGAADFTAHNLATGYLHITCLADLFRATETADLTQLSDHIRVDDADSWVAEIPGGLEVVSGGGAISLRYPFDLPTFYSSARGPA